MERLKLTVSRSPGQDWGTFRMPGDAARPMVESGLELGSHHIDTAAMYDNEAAVGAALAASGINRADLFVSTKVWHDKLSPDALRRSFDTSLGKLRLDHIDLFLVQTADVALGHKALNNVDP